MLPAMTTYKGHTVSVLNPDPDTICIEDIAHHLSLQNRFNGATVRPYSVAAHSLYMANYLVPEEYKLEALMHDAAEAYIGDMIAPLKNQMPEFRSVEEIFWVVIADKWGLPRQMSDVVREADWFACRVEASRLRTNGTALFETSDADRSTEGAPPLSTDGWEAVKWNFLDLWNDLI